MNKYFLFKIVLIIFLSAYQYSYGAELRVVKVGADDHYPVLFHDKDGSAKGFYADILTEIGKKENIRFEYVFGTWTDMLDRLKSGKIDLMSGVGFSEERSLYMDYCKNPLLTVWGELYVLQTSEINSLFDITGKKIGVIKGDLNAKNFLELTKKFAIRYQFVELTGYTELFKAIAEKKVDAGVAGITFGAYKKNEYGLRETGVVFNPYDLYFAVTKGKNQHLIKILDTYLDDWKHQDNSVYSVSKKIWLYGSADAVIVFPVWLINSLMALGVIIASAAVFIMLLKLQVKRATEKILQREYSLLESEARLIKTQEMSHVGSWELDIKTEKLIWSDEVYRIFELRPQEFAATHEAFLASVHPDDRDLVNAAYFNSVKENKSSYNVEHRVIRKYSGEVRYVYEKCEHIKDASGIIVRSVGMIQDITDRKMAEDEIKRKNEELIALSIEMEAANEELTATSDELTTNEKILRETLSVNKLAEEKILNLLSEKELLLQEVHHRIKNNMNTIKGLLTLQLLAEEDPSVTSSLSDAESRVQSMIMLYDKLYCTENYRELAIKEYLQSLAEEVVGSFPNRGIVKIETEIDDFILNVNRLSPLGIIVNELLTNIMKYAFVGRDNGLIKIAASIKDNHACIVIKDNGVGISESVIFERSTGFGLELVDMLVEQIGGSLKIEREEGTKFVLEFEM